MPVPMEGAIFEQNFFCTISIRLKVMIFGTQKVSAIVEIPKFAFYEPP